MTVSPRSMGKPMTKLKVMSARSMHAVVGTISDAFAGATGTAVALSFGTVGALERRTQAGETADVIITGGPAMERLQQRGDIDRASRCQLATTSIGIAVRAGATAPDISTPAAFRQALIGARTVAFSDAGAGGSAGVYLAKLLVDIGLAEEIARKAMPQPSGSEVARHVAAGEADIGLTLIAEIVSVEGARVLGPLPAPYGNDTTYHVAIMAACGNPDAARAFISALKRPDRRSLWEAAGFAPA